MLSVEFGDLPDLILRLQRELFVAGAELATNPDAWDRLEDGRTRVSAEMVDGIDGLLRDLEAHIEMPREFVVPGETPTSAALEVARTTLRRAERRAVTLQSRGIDSGTSFATVFEPARRSAVGPRQGRRAGGVPVRHPVTNRSPQARKHKESGLMQSQGLPSQLGVRPAPELANQFLVQSFAWMFAAVLVTAVVAVPVIGNEAFLNFAYQRLAASSRSRRSRSASASSSRSRRPARSSGCCCSSSTRRRSASRSA